MADHSEDFIDGRAADLQSVRGQSDGVFGPILCRVVNAYSDQEFPWKFVYQACSHRFPTGKRCLTSRRLNTACHSQDPTVIAYRFIIYLTDGSFNSVESSPVGVICFDEASVLLGMSATEFHAKTSEEQLELVSKCSVTFPIVKVWIRVRGDSLLLHRMSFSCLQSELRLSRSARGPSSSVRSVAVGKRQVSFEEFSEMRRTLAEVYEMITSKAGEKAARKPSDTAGSNLSAAAESVDAETVRDTESTSGSGADVGSQFCTMTRKQLQTLCKRNSIPANRSNAYMIEALESKFKNIGDLVEDA